jgi:hypothetical protein
MVPVMPPDLHARQSPLIIGFHDDFIYETQEKDRAYGVGVMSRETRRQS